MKINRCICALLLGGVNKFDPIAGRRDNWHAEVALSELIVSGSVAIDAANSATPKLAQVNRQRQISSPGGLHLLLYNCHSKGSQAQGGVGQNCRPQK
jgi:hypothetical protein